MACCPPPTPYGSAPVVHSLGYELERKDRPGIAVDLSSTIESQGTLDFMLVKNVGIGTYVGWVLAEFLLLANGGNKVRRYIVMGTSTSHTDCGLVAGTLIYTVVHHWSVYFQVVVPLVVEMRILTLLTLPSAGGECRPLSGLN